MKQQYTWGLLLNNYDLPIGKGLVMGVYCYRDAGRLNEVHLITFCQHARFHHIRIRKNGPAHWFVVDLMAWLEIEIVHQSLQDAYRFACGLLRLLHHDECVIPNVIAHLGAEWHLTDEEVHHKDLAERHDEWNKGASND